MARLSAESDTRRKIIDATEKALRRFGASKVTVVDVARTLAMSHANVYRFFSSKEALLDAVAARWLHSVSNPLEAIAYNKTLSASERLTRWFEELRKIKRRKIDDDPEFFQMFREVTEHASEVVEEHVGSLLTQLTSMVSAGVTGGEFPSHLQAAETARTLFRATLVLHHPAVATQKPAATPAEAKALVALLLAGLKNSPEFERTARAPKSR